MAMTKRVYCDQLIEALTSECGVGRGAIKEGFPLMFWPGQGHVSLIDHLYSSAECDCQEFLS